MWERVQDVGFQVWVGGVRVKQKERALIGYQQALQCLVKHIRSAEQREQGREEEVKKMIQKGQRRKGGRKKRKAEGRSGVYTGREANRNG